jgi:serine phosphatase RsbU (regulator of sigma subunit)/AcrR family transcriptional regulator
MNSHGRRDARRHREAILAAAAAQLRAGNPLEIRRIASAAGVSRSTVHRHFRNAAGLEQGLVEAAFEQVVSALEERALATRPPLAALRDLIARLAATGEQFGLAHVEMRSLSAGARAIAPTLAPLADQVLDIAEITRSGREGLEAGAADLVVSALVATNAERLFRTITERLDRGLVVVDAAGRLLASNAAGRSAFGIQEPAPPGLYVREPDEVRYEDDSPAPSNLHPLTLAVASRESQPVAIRGHRTQVGAEPRWFVVEADVLWLASDDEPYGILAVLTEVTAERRAELAQLRPAGMLGRDEPLILDAARALDDVPAHLLPDQLVAEARRLVNVPVALYVLDIDGSHLLRLAGAEEFPRRIDAPLALGPELAHDGIPELRARLATKLPGAVLAPLWLRGRAVGVLLAAGANESVLAELARQGAAALELGNGYTDTLDAARRRKEINPAAELQQSLLPPRIARFGSGRIGSSMLPAYEVGGDWFDYVENRDGAWFAIADASGKGARAGALGSLGLAALRAARRNGCDLADAARTIHETLADAGEDSFYLTAIVARWNAAYRSFSWINAGHPRPLLIRSDGRVDELDTAPDLPLGLFARERKFRINHRRIAPGERLILYTDGISNRPTRNGLFGRDGIVAAVAAASDGTATATARAIQAAVVEATTDPLRDDAAVIVFAPDGP